MKQSKRQLLKLMAAYLGANFIAPSSALERHPYDLIVQNVAVVSAERPSVLEGVHVAIKDERIVKISTKPIKGRAKQTLDGTGKYLTPGLIDSHVHLYHAPGLKRRYTDDFDRLYNQYLDQLPQSYLYYGYTTVIEPNADKQTNERFLSAKLHPELLHCGKGVIISDGFMAMEFPRDSLMQGARNFLYDRFSNGYLPEGVNPEDHSPKAVIESRLNSGASCIKIYYEEALWMPEEAREFRLPSVDIMQELVAEAHKNNLPVMLHATSPAAYSFGAKVGVDIIAHGPWDWEHNNYSAPSVPENLMMAVSDVAEAGIKVQPTFGALRHTLSMFTPSLLADEGIRHVLPAEFTTYLESDAQQQKDIFLRVFGNRIVSGGDEDSVGSAMTNMFARYGRIVASMNEYHTQFLFGTDTSSGGFGWGSPAGLSGYLEMQEWQQSGISLKSIFAAATLENAREFGVLDRLGTVEEGKQADLLLMEKNPWTDVNAYDSIEHVILKGVSHTRCEFSALGSACSH